MTHQVHKAKLRLKVRYWELTKSGSSPSEGKEMQVCKIENTTLMAVNFIPSYYDQTLKMHMSNTGHLL